MISALGRWLLAVPDQVLGFVAYVGGVAMLLVRAVKAIPSALLGHRGRLGRKSLAEQMVRVGVRSVPVVFLVSIFVGVILILQASPILRVFGAEAEAARITAVAVVRELGPLLSSLILAGYAGCAIAAELGTMKVGEELDALEAGAVDPVRFLVVPRVLATVVMVTTLAVFANGMGLLGGYLTGVYVLNLNGSDFVARMRDSLGPTDLLTGLLKAAVFGGIIALVACYEGLNVRMSDGAEGVGRATTQTVVRAGVCIVVMDALLTAAFLVLGLL